VTMMSLGMRFARALKVFPSFMQSPILTFKHSILYDIYSDLVSGTLYLAYILAFALLFFLLQIQIQASYLACCRMFFWHFCVPIGPSGAPSGHELEESVNLRTCTEGGDQKECSRRSERQDS
jgi:polyferredoxin